MIIKSCERLPEALSFASLLKKAGANPPRYGKKWDCPACGKRACLSVDESRGLFNCFHAGCDFKGSTATLARRLGLSPKLSPGEYRKRRAHERRLDERVHRLLTAKRERRDVVIDTLAHYYRMEHCCHTSGPNNPLIWDALAGIYAERLRLTAELLILNNAHARELERFLGLSRRSVEGDRDAAIDNVILRGGLTDGKGWFVPLQEESIVGIASDGGRCAPGWLYETVAPEGTKAWRADDTWYGASGRVIRVRL